MPGPRRLLLGDLSDNQRAVVMVLMTSAFAVLGFMAQTKLDERMGGPQEVRTTLALAVTSGCARAHGLRLACRNNGYTTSRSRIYAAQNYGS